MRNGISSRLLLLPALLLLLTQAALATPRAQAAEADGDPKSVAIAHIEISGLVPEEPQPTGPLGEQGQNLAKLLERIERVAEDDDVDGLYLKIGAGVLGRGQINEIAGAIAKVRASGKKTYAYTETAMMGGYLLALEADEIVQPPVGMLIVPGVRLELTYYKELFGKIGVKADMMQIGDYKGAAEPYTRTSMSPEFRKQLTSVVDDLYEQMIAHIAQRRSMKPDAVKAAIDQGLFVPAGAKEAGLIDAIEYPDELRARIAKAHDADQVVFKLNYGRQSIDTEFEGLGGLIKLMNLMTGNAGAGSGGRGDRLAIVYAVGPIMTGESQSLFGESTIGSDTLTAAIRKAAKNDRVKAIVLRVDSPGGSAIASDLIWRALEESGKPVVVSMGNIAASGGYYISMGADKIYAEPGTLTGSIGVVSGKFAVGGLFDKIGVDTDVVSRGKNSGMFALTDPFTESERAAMKKLMEEVYDDFTRKAAEGRGMEHVKLLELAGGRIWTGRQAKQVGLVDEVGTLEDAVAAAYELAGIDAEDAADPLILPKPPNFLEALFGPLENKQPRDADSPLARAAVLADVLPLPKLRTALLHWAAFEADRLQLVPSAYLEVR